MGLLDKFFKKEKLGLEEFMKSSDIEEIDAVHGKADFYVKPISLSQEEDLKIVENELRNKNVVLLSIAPMLKNPHKLRQIVQTLNVEIKKMNGDIAMISEDKMILTPAYVKIVKKKKA
jgi:SepF-like predicted cell division protein (DUF552 family)